LADLETEIILGDTLEQLVNSLNQKVQKVQKLWFFIEIKFKYLFLGFFHFFSCSAGELSHNIPSALTRVLHCATAGSCKHFLSVTSLYYTI